MQHIIMLIEENFTSLAYLQNYRRLDIITRAISTNQNPHFWQIWQKISPMRCIIPGMQVFYTNVDNFVERKNNRESYFYASF